MKKVAIIQRLLPHYRIPFFDELDSLLAKEGIQLDLIYGQGTTDENKKGDEVEWAKGIKIKNRYLKLTDRYLVYQPCFLKTRKHDLIIFEQASKNLINVLLVYLKSKHQKLAIWGHGKNFQQKKIASISEAFKQKINSNIDHFFAYNELSKRTMIEHGIDQHKITSVMNAVDTKKLKEEIQNIKNKDVDTFSERYELKPGHTGLFCSSMYEEKLIPFLIESSIQIHTKIPYFKLIIIGSGPNENLAIEAARAHEHIIYLGKLYGIEKALAYKASDFMMNPGLVGLNILDSFVAELPMLTTNYPYHSPEIDYLKNNQNGLLIEKSDYANQIALLIKDANSLSHLKKGCKESGDLYTVEGMARNFATGIISCLNS